MVSDLDTDIVSRFNDKEFRKALRADPQTAMRKYTAGSGWQPDDDAQFIVKTNTKNTFYVVMPNDNSDINIDFLGLVSAGKNAPGVAHPLSSAACASTACSTLSSASTLDIARVTER